MRYAKTTLLILWLLFTCSNLPIFLSSNDIESEKRREQIKQANIFIGKALDSSEKEKYREALRYYDQALSIVRDLQDRRWEGGILNDIGLVYKGMGDFNRALSYFRWALTIHREVKNLPWEGNSLYNIGYLYKDQGHLEKAATYLEQAYQIKKEKGPCPENICLLDEIARIYYSLKQYPSALKYLKKTQPIYRRLKNHREEARVLYYIGSIYNTLDEYGKALKSFNNALELYRKVKDPIGEGNTLYSLGSTYNHLRNYCNAIACFEDALGIKKELNDRSGEAAVYASLGLIYNELQQHEKAIPYLNKALVIKREIKDRYWEGIILGNIGGLFNSLRYYSMAEEYYLMALNIDRELENRTGEGGNINNLGMVYMEFGEIQKALNHFQSALLFHAEEENEAWKSNTCSNLMATWEKLDKHPLAIFYGKQAVNVQQEIRDKIWTLEKKIQQNYLDYYKYRYRGLANILIIKGRLSEAQQVLDMLKENEFFKFVGRNHSTAVKLDSRVDFTDFERKWLVKHDNVIREVARVNSQFQDLKSKRNKTAAEIKKFTELQAAIKRVQVSYKMFLAQLTRAFDDYERDKITMKKDIQKLESKARAFQTNLSYLDKGRKEGKTAALHYLVFGGNVSIILTTPHSQSVKKSKIDEKEFNPMIFDYRKLVVKLEQTRRTLQRLQAAIRGRGVLLTEAFNRVEKSLSRKKREYEKRLYDVIFKPVDEDLKKYGATDLVVSLDGVIRYIPLCALWDGESHLLQRYRIALTTTSSMKNIHDPPVKEKRILGLGAGKGGRGFPPLPYVRREIRSIVRDGSKGFQGLITGKAFLDEDFTRETMISQLKKKYPLVHISSHFQFSPGDETRNHLLLGDGTTMALSEIRRMGRLFDGVKLLVLSACQTGVGGNGEEIDGFGELAQQGGADCVIASLWPVADESTKELMVAFYKNLKSGNGISKIEALRQAQLELAGLEDLLGKDKSTVNTTVRHRTKYASSYFWGPFIMIGNWR